MLSFKYIFFFSLISFTFQLDHCIQIAKICKSRKPVKESGSIANCIFYEIGDSSKCYSCDINYVLSNEADKCISFPLCSDLKEGNKECADCYSGYYLKNNVCTKIPIDNCASSDDGKICDYCENYSKINSDRTICNLKNLIEGCYYYDENGYCTVCEDDYESSGSGSSFKCTFKSCDTGDKALEYCEICESGYYPDMLNDGNCKPYTTGNSNNSGRNEIRFGFIILLFTLLI